jgi:signal transduction histidine kinase
VRAGTDPRHPSHVKCRHLVIQEDIMLSYSLRHFVYGLTLVTGLALVANGAFALGTADDAKAMLDKTAAALNADKAKTLDEINNAQNGFLQGDIYPFCFNLSDGKVIAVASPSVKAFIGKDIRTVKDPTGDAFGARMYAAAKAGEVNEVSYKFPKPGSDKTPVPKVTFLTAVAGLGCGVGYYK